MLIWSEKSKAKQSCYTLAGKWSLAVKGLTRALPRECSALTTERVTR